jgi:hypothetical protein
MEKGITKTRWKSSKVLAIVALTVSSSVFAQQQEGDGLHGYLGSNTATTAPAAYGEGFGMYAAIWPLLTKPIGNFQIGLPSSWITPENADNKTTPMCPVGTYARDNWPQDGPTWDGVFQTMEGGPGYWAGNKFQYGLPKFKMNSTPNCYDEEISTPSWSFFGDQLPDNMLGIAQIANCILVPQDGMPFQGSPAGELLGASYMALPLTNAYNDSHPVGNKSWTCYLNTTNFKGPLAFYLPETWAKISINYPSDSGRGLDARKSYTNLSGGTLEMNTVPKIVATDNSGNTFYKIPKLQYPIDNQNRTILSKDVTLYDSSTIYNDILAWRNGGSVPSGLFNMSGSTKPQMTTSAVDYDQGGIPVTGINERAKPVIFSGNEFGIQWTGNYTGGYASFPEYFRDSSGYRVAVNPSAVPASTGLLAAEFTAPDPNPSPYNVPLTGAWATPGPASGPYYAYLVDGSKVTYYWYRFIDQPVFQQYNFSQGKKDSLQALIVSMHRNWTKDKNYMPNPSNGALVSFDPALLVTPPTGFEVGYVPLVTKQEISNSKPPIVNLTAPTNNVSYTAPANIIITASASDVDGTIKNVKFYNGTTLLNTDATAPYSYTWNKVAAGTYSITAVATDNSGLITSSSASTVIVKGPCTPSPITPYVVVSNGNWTQSDTAMLPVGSNLMFGPQSTTDGTWSWSGPNNYSATSRETTINNIQPSQAGNYVVTFTSTDGCISSNTSVVTVTAPVNQVPTINLTAPINNTGYTAPASISIAANASDADGTISSVKFYNGTTLLSTDNTAPYIYSWTSVLVGTYSITATATDNNNAITTSAVVNVNVSAANVAPIAILSSPQTSTTNYAPATIVLNATATDDNAVTKVEFYNGTNLLGTDNAAPYSYTWANAVAGTYAFTAKAYDSAGLTGTSTTISIVVNLATTTDPTGNGIVGKACVAANQSNSYTVFPEVTQVSKVSWWSNSGAVFTPISEDMFGTSLVFPDNAQGLAIKITAGVNFNAAPWYKEYTLQVKVGGCTGNAPTFRVTAIPQPFVQTTLLTTDNNEIIHAIIVYDAQGVIVENVQNISQMNYELGRSYPSGLYIVHVYANDQVSIIKVMKQ